MSDTVVSVLTPPGAGAIATVEVAGPKAWQIARQLFKPAGKKPLPEESTLHRFWFGKWADGDEVVLAVKQIKPETVVEIHCHGGRRVVPWLIGSLTACGFAMRLAKPHAVPVTQAPTLRTAAILLDQYHGTFERAIQGLLDSFDPAALAELASFAPLGRHLVEPWKVAIAGLPNVGKSSLVNALAGYQRSVVSEFPGTTRDVVTVPVAFDGWPVELADTAGLREAAGLEAEGIALADRYLHEADLVIWVMDATEPREPHPGLSIGLRVLNKCDRMQPALPDAIRVSALTGAGIPGLAAAIARHLVPHPPVPGAAVPFTNQLADLVERGNRAGTQEEAIALLRDCLDRCR
jgi:tRNA modification GTPase